MLWRHKNPESTSMYEFKTLVEKKYHVKLNGYEALRQWSINHIAQFWEEIWHFTGIRASTPFTKVVDEEAPIFPRPTFFQGARLNFAENLLYPMSNPNEDSLAIIAATEETREHVTWKQLRERVRECSAAMKTLGVKEGDRVAGFVANHTNTLVALLSTASLGAIWTAISPDTGVTAVLDRIRQIEPVVLFADNGVMYNGKIHQTHNKISEIVEGLPQLQAAVIFESVAEQPFDMKDINVAKGKALTFIDFVKSGSPDPGLEFAQLQPDHPVYILYSSGTTGKPKCIVHGAIGTLLQHKKEHMIQGDVTPGDRVFYFTTTSWMMHHWLLSSLASGATLILYDGSPFRPLDAAGVGDMAMPRLIDELGITHFGTSAKYLSVLEQKNVMPRPTLSLKTLKAIYSTGSPLAPSTFEYTYRAFGPDINLGSITGGTDIISLFGAPSLLSPVYAGEIQVRGLGMAVEAWDYEGKNVTDTGEPGDLVCVKPFPCQPVMFWGAEGEEKYRKSYFETFPGVWHHGDFVKFNPETGGMIMLGRSDGILKPSGVRFGSAEIYNILLQHYPEVEDALCIGRRREMDTDETVVLFVKMAEGKGYSQDLAKRIQGTVKAELSARHVPGIIDECLEIPVTTNGKKVEVAVKQILCGMNVKTSASVANADCLDWYRRWAQEH
ncbi:MAG: acetoacetate- ligase [Lasallia pustulata]|uniref:Acetoacetate-ligase n=1 Tax=Lasallia pustulata TaxID=136370 RepID=A0A5M8PGV2_9LECA|nr:MAG: acetoacetate- ligase [Lasallia pustulata]